MKTNNIRQHNAVVEAIEVQASIMSALLVLRANMEDEERFQSCHGVGAVNVILRSLIDIQCSLEDCFEVME